MFGTQRSYWPVLYFILNFLHRLWPIQCIDSAGRFVALGSASKFASHSPESPSGVSMMKEDGLEGDIAKERYALVVRAVKGWRKDVPVKLEPNVDNRVRAHRAIWAHNYLPKKNMKKPSEKPSEKSSKKPSEKPYNKPMSRLRYNTKAKGDIIDTQDQKAALILKTDDTKEDVAPNPQIDEEDILASELIEKLQKAYPQRASGLSHYKEDPVYTFDTLPILWEFILSKKEIDLDYRLHALELVMLKISPYEETLRDRLRNFQKITNEDILSAYECTYFRIVFWKIFETTAHEELYSYATEAYDILSNTLHLFWSRHLQTLIVAAENEQPEFWIKDYYTSALRSGTVRSHHSEYSLQTWKARRTS
ncbi:hypothetical protein CROQUDRAFT_671291 [Cronartium quercuum f. sp. fusiforme G11]|uniref:Uncharacterized protein n=1 Tax=Cronartium quercuum f. sp. fusiforme G11 TaxID=708437 RepID=A0A9P6NLH2_9BASI|nr:hypothetical protein CROQUDRAFT_671291 [Cronartium quercuum f. sp. fusiforme G11]